MMLKNMSRSNSLLAMPSAVPAAGGCSVLVIAISNMDKPTAMASDRCSRISLSPRNVSTGARNNKTANSDPSPSATACLPPPERIRAAGSKVR